MFGICGSFVVAVDDEDELFTTFELTCLECMVADPSTKSSAAACRCWALITYNKIFKINCARLSPKNEVLAFKTYGSFLY